MKDIKNRSGIPWSILYSKKLNQTEKMVFIALKDRAYQIDKTCVKGFYCYVDWLSANLQLSDSTVKRALKGLKDKKIISAKRVKLHKKVVNLWSINWELIDEVTKKFKFAEVEYEEVDNLNDNVQDEIDIPSNEIQIEEEVKQECISADRESDNPENNNDEQIEVDMKLYDYPIGINSDEFYTAFVSGSLQYWLHLFNQDKKDDLKNEIDKWAAYAANRFYDGEHVDECKNKIYEYLNNRLVS